MRAKMVIVMYESGPGSEERNEISRNGFDSLRDVPFAGAQRLVMSPNLERTQESGSERLTREREARLEANRHRQETKLTLALGSDEGYSALGRVEVPGVTSDVQVRAFERLRSPRFTRDEENRLLRLIGCPMDRAVGGENAVGDVAARVLNDPGMTQILGTSMIAGYDGSTIPQEYGYLLIDSIRRSCPSPADFSERMENMMQAKFENTIGGDDYRKFRESTENFMDCIYGKRYEYWKALTALKKESLQYEQRYGAEALQFSLTTPGEQERMLGTARIEGDTFKYGGLEYKMTPEYLAQNGFGPKYMAKFDGAEIGLSHAFKSERGRDIALGYVKRGNEYCVRSYYKSQSQGVWRLLADYTVNEGNGEGVGWYGKGVSEEQLILPSEMQEALSKIEDDGVQVVNPMIADFLLCGAAYRYGSKAEYNAARMQGALRGDVYRETSWTPTLSLGHISSEKSAPQDVKLEGGTDVDLNDIDRRPKYSCNTSFYGKVDVFLADSKDRYLRYSVLRNSEGKRWFGGAEVKNSPINSCGLRANWVELGDLSTPLIEYSVAAGKYGEPSKKVSGHHEMWSYLSGIPVIRQIVRMDFDNNDRRHA